MDSFTVAGCVAPDLGLCALRRARRDAPPLGPEAGRCAVARRAYGVPGLDAARRVSPALVARGRAKVSARSALQVPELVRIAHHVDGRDVLAVNLKRDGLHAPVNVEEKTR
jgi:hypothetical protein